MLSWRGKYFNRCFSGLLIQEYFLGESVFRKLACSHRQEVVKLVIENKERTTKFLPRLKSFTSFAKIVRRVFLPLFPVQEWKVLHLCSLAALLAALLCERCLFILLMLSSILLYLFSFSFLGWQGWSNRMRDLKHAAKCCGLTKLHGFLYQDSCVFT